MNDPNRQAGAGLARPVPLADGSASDYPKLMAAEEVAHSKRSQGAWPAAAQSLLVTVVIALFVITFLLQAFRIPSPSMENTLLVGDYLLADKVYFAQGGWGRWALPYSKIRRGDIILFHYPVQPSQHFVKRVIGVPGDRVRIANRRVIVNGTALNERRYVIHRQATSDYFRDNFPNVDLIPRDIQSKWWLQLHRQVRDGELVVPPRNYFVLGDNRDDSLDSRYWGFVPEENVIGRPLIIYWSLTTPWRGMPAANRPGDTLKRFVYAVTHPWQFTRWDRTLRLVR